jgi:hypothetical protein
LIQIDFLAFDNRFVTLELLENLVRYASFFFSTKELLNLDIAALFFSAKTILNQKDPGLA